MKSSKSQYATGSIIGHTIVGASPGRTVTAQAIDAVPQTSLNEYMTEISAPAHVKFCVAPSTKNPGTSSEVIPQEVIPVAKGASNSNASQKSTASITGHAIEGPAAGNTVTGQAVETVPQTSENAYIILNIPPSQSTSDSKIPRTSEVIPQEVIPVAKGASNSNAPQKSTASITGQAIEGPAAGKTVTGQAVETMPQTSENAYIILNVPPSQSTSNSKLPRTSEVIPQEVIPVAKGASNSNASQTSTASITGQAIDGPAAGKTVTGQAVETVPQTSENSYIILNVPPSQSTSDSKLPRTSDVIPQEVIPVARGASNANASQKSIASITGQAIEGPAAGNTVIGQAIVTVPQASVKVYRISIDPPSHNTTESKLPVTSDVIPQEVIPVAKGASNAIASQKSIAPITGQAIEGPDPGITVTAQTVDEVPHASTNA